MTTLPDNWTLIDRGLLGRCPKCGHGKLFRRYLKQVDACAECGEALGHIRADDGPAWLTILVVGHIIVPLAFAVDGGKSWPFWAVTAVLMTLALLPRAKGIFIAFIWKTGCSGSEKNG